MGLNKAFIILWWALLGVIPLSIVQAKTTGITDSLNTVLFKISSGTSSKVSYLFGTHHAFGKSFFDPLTKANQALADSEFLIKENLNIQGERAQDIINRRTTLTKWEKYLTKKDLSFINNLFASSPTDYRKMTATEMYVFLNRYFKQQLCLHKDANDTSLSLDDYIGFKAVELNMDRYGLETTEEQIALLNKDVEGMPKRIHKRRLANIVAKIRSKDVNSCEETSWYAQMEIDYQLNRPCGNTLVLTERNEQWMMTITGLIKEKNCFIAVGLSHLMYECGLLNQLEKLGYTITPVPVK
ncbi:MAG: TraB/GumN family protein [Owenweeksia sp.]|nr:TraB/GumN family protein [Owenweeksia sp.]